MTGTTFRPFTNALRTERRLSAGGLRAVVKGEVLALHVPRFLGPRTALKIADRLQREGRHLDGYVSEPKIKRFGETFYDTFHDPTRRERYFSAASATMAALRAACLPFANPIDLLRSQVDDAWPAGARRAMLGGRRLFAGTARVFPAGVAALPHVDSLGFDAGAAGGAPALLGQTSVNVYLRMPPAGGELDVWTTRFATPEQELAFRVPGHRYALDVAKLGDPAVSLRPQDGDLIIFSSVNAHAVRPPEGGPRVTASFFLGYAGPQLPLIYWS